ncbi:hypothetical protein F4820DRAFT_411280 [Hypoxylon rubiginosum]|uniref:Uncharacterized protein n=1 Tax=Hypoxylon rubiginosum TaxID=110542 RepID=A0ACB9Z8T8_9PEZI|nr:hypothetical protein F4820DRAFT_411280 [Hypoxylon rubiginosum]
MASNVELVRNRFHKDMWKRAVTNTSARIPCSCGKYQYYSQKCGCLYTSVHLKCGKTLSDKSGLPILCKAGHGRKVRVWDVLVPFYCEECRIKNVRWAGKEPSPSRMSNRSRSRRRKSRRERYKDGKLGHY